MGQVRNFGQFSWRKKAPRKRVKLTHKTSIYSQYFSLTGNKGKLFILSVPLLHFSLLGKTVCLPKSQERLPVRAQTPLHLPHMLSWHEKTLQSLSPVRSFSCAHEVAQTPHENSMLLASKYSKRFQKHVWERGKELERALDDAFGI